MLCALSGAWAADIEAAAAAAVADAKAQATAQAALPPPAGSAHTALTSMCSHI